MLGQQLLLSPALRQLPRVPEHDLMVIDTDLDGNTAGVILVDHRIEQRFAQGLQRKQVALYTLNALVADICLEVFAVE